VNFESDGVRLHYELHGPPEGTPIVLVHGFASDYRLNWVGTRWQETLTTSGFHVIGLDCRGHGHSDKPHDPAAYALGVMAADVRRLLDHLGVEKAVLLGFSMGARIGLQAVMDFPECLRRAVLGGLGMRGAASEADSIARAFRGGPAETPTVQSFYQFASGRPGNDMEALAACILGQQPELTPDRLTAIRVPILVVVGERDALARDADELVELIPTARLTRIPGRDHLGTVPAREFKKAAVEFLGEA
jgi:pimeloyl-ACP methyl ester carboxylesterase